MVRTVKDVLVDNGLDPAENPVVTCPCGRDTSADCCVDLTPLPLEYRQALGLDRVDYICGACQARLFCDRHVSEDEFYALLGQDDVGALFEHNARDVEWTRGCDGRHEAYKPKHEKVTARRAELRKLEAPAEPVPVSAPIPLRYRVRLLNVVLHPAA